MTWHNRCNSLLPGTSAWNSTVEGEKQRKGDFSKAKCHARGSCETFFGSRVASASVPIPTWHPSPMHAIWLGYTILQNTLRSFHTVPTMLHGKCSKISPLPPPQTLTLMSSTVGSKATTSIDIAIVVMYTTMCFGLKETFP